MYTTSISFLLLQILLFLFHRKVRGRRHSRAAKDRRGGRGEQRRREVRESRRGEKRERRRKGRMEKRKDTKGVSWHVKVGTNLALNMSSHFPKVFQVFLSVNIMASAHVEGCTTKRAFNAK